MKNIYPVVSALMKAARSPRDRALILVGAYTGWSSMDLATLTVGELRRMLDTDKALKQVRPKLLGYLKSLQREDHERVFRSSTYGGKLDRTAIYRIISTAIHRAWGKSKRGGVRFLQALERVLHGRWKNWVVRAVLTTGQLPSWRYYELDTLESWPAYYSSVGISP